MYTLPELMEVEMLYNALANLGDYYMLKPYVPPHLLVDILKDYENDWKQYNPSKPNIARLGLSLTSLDGGLSGTPDLDSLFEYNQRHGTNYNEDSFKTPTPVLKNKIINDTLKPFLPHLGRSHYIRLDEGGHFPFHRDSPYMGSNTFRLISLAHGCNSASFCFIFNGQRIFLEEGRIYYMNTKVEHALFSFAPRAIIMALNVILSQESVKLVIDHLEAT